METKLDLTPGADALTLWRCPGCGCPFTVRGSDTVQTGEAIPESLTVAGGLARSKDGLCYYAALDLCSCDKCKAACYLVRLDVVNAPEVSEEWADGYFRRNEEIAEPFARFTVTAHTRGLPERWILDRTETAAGLLDEHCFGPFTKGEKGPSGNLWQNAAAALLGRVWPLVTAEMRVLKPSGRNPPKT